MMCCMCKSSVRRPASIRSSASVPCIYCRNIFVYVVRSCHSRCAAFLHPSGHVYIGNLSKANALRLWGRDISHSGSDEERYFNPQPRCSGSRNSESNGFQYMR